MTYVDADVPALSTFAGPLQFRERKPDARLRPATGAEAQDIRAVEDAMKDCLTPTSRQPLVNSRACLDPANWMWLDELSPRDLLQAGTLTLGLFTNSNRWINRRVERISFRDARGADHEIIVDFELPANMPAVAQLPDNSKEKVYIAPLFFLATVPARELIDSAKQPVPLATYSNVDLVNQDGDQLPLVTRRASGRIAAVALVTRAAQILENRKLDCDLLEEITRIAVGDDRTRDTALHTLFTAPLNYDDRARAALRGDETFQELAFAFATHAVVLALYHGMDPPRRSIVTLSYDEELQKQRQSPGKELRRSLGWKTKLVQIRLNEIGAASTYHVEINGVRLV